MRLFARATSWIAWAHFRRAWTSRRLLVCVLIALLPALIALVASAASKRISPGELAANLSFAMLLQIIVPVTTLLFGSAVIAEEVEDRTITYLFTRPIPRAAVLFGRFLSSAVVLVVVLTAATAALLALSGRAQGPGPALDAATSLRVHVSVVVGAVAYSALFACLGSFFRHPMLVGIGYAFAIEGFLANLPGRTQVATVQYHVRSFLAGSGSLDLKRVEEFDSNAFESPARALTILGLITVLALGLGAWRVTRRQFEVPS